MWSKTPAPSFTKKLVSFTQWYMLSVPWESIVISAGFGRCKDKLTFTSDWVEGVFLPRDQSGYAARPLLSSVREPRGIWGQSPPSFQPTYMSLSEIEHGGFGYQWLQGHHVRSLNYSSRWQIVSHCTVLQLPSILFQAYILFSCHGGIFL